MKNAFARPQPEPTPDELDHYRETVARGLALLPVFLALVDRIAAPVRRAAPRPGETNR